jgi:hydroxypyruvate isomerase
MKRRKFISSVAAATVAASPLAKASAVADAPVVAGSAAASSPARSAVRTGDTFTLNYAPHFNMFRNHGGDDLVDHVRFMHDQGFRALEDNGMAGRPVELQERIAAEMARLGMRMGVFVAHRIYWNEPNLASGDAEKRDEFLDDVRNAVEVAQRVNATWMTVVPGHIDLRQEMEYQTVNVVETLKRAAEILEPHGLVIVLEPLNWWANHPGVFLTRIPQAYQICKHVNSPSVKILFDIYHQQIQEGNLIPNIDRAWDEIGYFQIGDNPGRREPGTGEINYANVFKHLHEKGYDGVLGMEHGNSRPGTEGELAVIEAYRAADPAA